MSERRPDLIVAPESRGDPSTRSDLSGRRSLGMTLGRGVGAPCRGVVQGTKPEALRVETARQSVRLVTASEGGDVTFKRRITLTTLYNCHKFGIKEWKAMVPLTVRQ